MSTREYLDFDLVIARRDGGYDARVVASPAGEAAARFESPMSSLEAENFRLKTARGSTLRGTVAADADTARAIGSRLFGAAFSGDVQARLTASLHAARRAGAGLRLRLTG